MDALYYIVIFIFVLICLMLVGIILMQSSQTGGMGSAFGGGALNTAFGGQGADKLLVRTTSLLAVAFMILALAISRLPHPGSNVSVSSESDSIMVEDEANKEAKNNKSIEINKEADKSVSP